MQCLQYKFGHIGLYFSFCHAQKRVCICLWSLSGTVSFRFFNLLSSFFLTFWPLSGVIRFRFFNLLSSFFQIFQPLFGEVRFRLFNFLVFFFQIELKAHAIKAMIMQFIWKAYLVSVDRNQITDVFSVGNLKLSVNYPRFYSICWNCFCFKICLMDGYLFFLAPTSGE